MKGSDWVIKKVLDEVASTRCKDNDITKLGGKNFIIWVIIALVLVGGFASSACNPCQRPVGPCRGNVVPAGTFGGSGIWVLAALAFLLCSGGKGLGGLGSGNVNTNVINIDQDDDYDDYVDC